MLFSVPWTINWPERAPVEAPQRILPVFTLQFFKLQCGQRFPQDRREPPDALTD